MNLKQRVARIKRQTFRDLARLVVPELEIPDGGGMIRCPLPTHEDRTPSCKLSPKGWKCFGCQEGGDVIDLVQKVYDLDFRASICHIEEALGFEDSSPDELDEMRFELATKTQPSSVSAEEWDQAVQSIEFDFLVRMEPYLKSQDPLVVDLVLGPSEYVFEELRGAAANIPTTTRGFRVKLKELASWVVGWIKGIENSVLLATGKDRLTVISQKQKQKR